MFPKVFFFFFFFFQNIYKQALLLYMFFGDRSVLQAYCIDYAESERIAQGYNTVINPIPSLCYCHQNVIFQIILNCTYTNLLSCLLGSVLFRTSVYTGAKQASRIPAGSKQDNSLHNDDVKDVSVSTTESQYWSAQYKKIDKQSHLLYDLIVWFCYLGH